LDWIEQSNSLLRLRRYINLLLT